MKLPEDLRKPLLSSLIALSIGAIGYFLSQMLQAISGPFWQHVAPAVPPSILLPLCSLLLLLVFLLSAWVIYLHLRDLPHRIRSRYRFVPTEGFYAHRRTGTFFCPKCLLSPSALESPLADIGDNGNWRCRAPDCKATFMDTRARKALQAEQEAEQAKIPRYNSYS